MAFKIAKVLDYGTSHPIVARLHIQTHQLVQWMAVTREQKDALFALYLESAKKLIRCFEISNGCCEEFEKNVKQYEKSNQEDGHLFPHIVGLAEDVETFLYIAKNFIRDLTAVLNIAFSTSFDAAIQFARDHDGKDGTISKWALRALGEDEPLTILLRDDQDWIGELVQKRNAVEHPNGRSGKLHIHNFIHLPDDRFRQPVWHLNDDPPGDLLGGLRIACENMFTFAEELLVLTVRKKLSSPIVDIFEIPESERSTSEPIRYTVHFKEGFPPSETLDQR
ncbi:MAG: hypothetical protein ACYC1L_00970 [Alphaproteobacteria bacterium]